MHLNYGAGEDSRESLGRKEIKPVNPRGNQPWIFIGRTDAQPEAPILWPPDLKSRNIGKDPDARKDWRQEDKGVIEDKMVGWHHGLKAHEFEQTPGKRRTGKPGVLQSMGSQRAGHDWVTDNSKVLRVETTLTRESHSQAKVLYLAGDSGVNEGPALWDLWSKGLCKHLFLH